MSYLLILWTAICNQKHFYFIMHIHSHTSLPGFSVEGSIYVDSLVAAMAVKMVLNVLQQVFYLIIFFFSTNVLRFYSNNLSYHTVKQNQLFLLVLIVV